MPGFRARRQSRPHPPCLRADRAHRVLPEWADLKADKGRRAPPVSRAGPRCNRAVPARVWEEGLPVVSARQVGLVRGRGFSGHQVGLVRDRGAKGRTP
jgi:hypothetical protein